TPVDPNNPTITEVEAWKNTNLSLLDQQNGTILTYYDPTPIYTIQPTLTINNPNSGFSVYSYRITSCIINSTELLTAPIDVWIANSYVYIGQIGTLIRNYFTSNNIIGQVDDGAFGETNDVFIYGVQGSTLSFSMTTEYSLDVTPTTFVTTTVSGTTTATLAPQVYDCNTPLYTFILNKNNTISKISQPESLFFKEQTIIDAGVDKYGRIYRYGYIGIGMNRPKAPLHILGLGDSSEPYLSDAAIYIGGNGKKIYWGDNFKTPESGINVHNLSLGEWNGDSDAFAFHAKTGHRFYLKASAWDDNNSTQYPAFFIRNAVSGASNVGKIGLNTNNPRVSVDFGKLTNPDGVIANKDGMIIPGGTIAERPSTPVESTIRYNSDSKCIEYYDGVSWKSDCKPYKIYTALLSQTGTNAPVATVLENDLYNPVTITRLFAGSYTIDCIDFIVGKVHISGATDWNGSGSTVIPLWDESQIIGYLEIYCNQSSGKIGFEVFNAAFTRIDWSVLMGASNLNFPEIKVYP
ncbi:MAG TPA: hypothetical protein PKD16_01495, partial [Saprospiraceae bacterium]|nr:hypothetical protein [Saprospiraceae bacterium]